MASYLSRLCLSSLLVSQHIRLPPQTLSSSPLPMQTTRITRSSVLGKRGHYQQQESSSLPSKSADQLQTPDSTPLSKRPRVSTLLIDSDGNKENIPPLCSQLLTPDPSPTTIRTSRSLRRSGTELVSPSRARHALRRYASTSTVAYHDSTPDPTVFSIATPPPSPASPLPLHIRARTLLRATCNSTDNQIAGRDTEYATIREFISSFLDDSAMIPDNSSPALYISGLPGCGKTALVNSVLGQLNPEADGVKIIFINCMALNNLDALWDRVFEELDAGGKQNSKYRKTKGRDAIEALLTGIRTKCILVLDELDHITPNSLTLTSLFSLPAATPSHLRLIGIANTLTLTSTPAPSLNIRTVHFAPYTSNQLFDILQMRLRPFFEIEAESAQGDPRKFLPTPALTLLTKKIAGMTGDVRSLFEVLRGAIDIAVTPAEAATTVTSGDSAAPSISPSHVLAALKAYKPSSGKSAVSTPSLGGASVSNSETVTKVKNLNLQARLVLLTVLLASKRLEAGLMLSGSSPTTSPRKATTSSLRRTASIVQSASTIDTNQLHSYYSAVLKRSDSGVFDPTNRSEFGDLLNVLEGNGLVSLSSSIGTAGRKPFGRSMPLGGKGAAGNVGSVKLVEGIWCEEILRGLGINNVPRVNGEVDACEEEVEVIWQREQAKTAKDVKIMNTATSKGNRGDIFAGAFEL